MPSPAHNQQQMSTGAEGGLVPSCGLRRSTPAVVHYDTQASHHGFSLPVEMTHTSLKTGPAIVPGAFPILTRLRILLPRRAARPVQWPSLLCTGRPLLEPLSNHAVSLLGAGVMDSIRHPRCNSRPSLCRLSHSLSDKALKFTFRRAGHRLQNIAYAPHYHRQPAPFQACRLSCSPTWQDERTNPWERQPKTGREK